MELRSLAGPLSLANTGNLAFSVSAHALQLPPPYSGSISCFALLASLSLYSFSFLYLCQHRRPPPSTRNTINTLDGFFTKKKQKQKMGISTIPLKPREISQVSSGWLYINYPCALSLHLLAKHTQYQLYD